VNEQYLFYKGEWIVMIYDALGTYMSDYNWEEKIEYLNKIRNRRGKAKE